MRYDWAGEEERARDLQDRLEILERAVRDYQRLCYAMKEYAQPGAPTLDDPAKFMEWLLQQAEARGFARARENLPRLAKALREWTTRSERDLYGIEAYSVREDAAGLRELIEKRPNVVVYISAVEYPDP